MARNSNDHANSNRPPDGCNVGGHQIWRRKCAGVRAIKSTYTKEAVLQQEHEQLLRRGRQSDTPQSDGESSPFQGTLSSPSPAGHPNYGDTNGNRTRSRSRNRSRSRDAGIYKYRYKYSEQQQEQEQYSDHADSSQLSEETEEISPNGHKSLESITTAVDHAKHHSAAAAAAADSTFGSSSYDSFNSSASFHSLPTAHVYSPSPPPAQDLITLNPTPPSLNARFPVIFDSDGTCTASSAVVQTQNMAVVKATTWSEMFFWVLVYVLLGSGFAVLVWDGVCGLVEVVIEWAWGVLCRILMELGV